MNDTAKDAGSPAARWQLAAAGLLLVGFALLVVYMLGQADDDAAVWDRRIYIYGSAEAIVFTAVGWLFGREVHRATAESAREDAAAAKADADEKGKQVTALTEESAKGRALKSAVEACEAGPQLEVAAMDVGAVPPPATAVSAVSSLATLKSLAAKLYDE